MKKELLIITTSELTINSFLLPLINKLKKKIKITIISNFYSRSYNQLKKQGITVYNLNINRKIKIISDLKILIQINKIIKKNKFKLIYTITPKAGLLGMFSGYINNVPQRIHIFTGQVWVNKFFIFKIFLKILDKLIFYFSTDILCDGLNQKKYLNQHGFVKPITVINNGSICGVNTSIFKPSKKAKLLFRKKFNIKDNEKIFLYTGRMSREKGIKNLLNTFFLLRKKNFMVHFFFVGFDEDGFFDKKTKNIEGIHYFEHTKNIDEFYKFSDIFITSSYREGFGISVAQAMSSKLPIIGPSIYGLKDLLINNLNSYTFKVGNDEQLYRCCLKLIKNNNAVVSLGLNGRKMIKKKYEEKKVISAYYNFFIGKLIV